MTTTLQATFDGKVFVPDGPVELTVGQKVQIQVEIPPAKVSATSLLELIEKWSAEPVDDSIPTDYAAQHDHYLYGTPKKDI